MIELNEKAITDEMLALSALRTMTAKNENSDTIRFRRMLTRDHLPGLRVILKIVFAETILELAPWMEDCPVTVTGIASTRPYDPDSNSLQPIALTGEDRWSNGMKLTVKRQLEHIVAAGTLGWATTEGDAEFAAMLQEKREAALSALKEHLAGDAAVTTAAGWP